MQTASAAALTLDELRGAQRDAIRERAWKSVEILQAQIDAIERVDVADITQAREKRRTR